MDAQQWVTRDGRRVHVFEMTDDHLANTVAYLRRHRAFRPHWLPRLSAELERRRTRKAP